MIKKALLALLVLGSLTTYAQKLKNSVLWEISGKNLSKPSYVFGTMHILCDATLKPKVIRALDATEQLYLEVKMDDMESMNAEMLKSINMKDNGKISEMCTPEQYKLIDDFFVAQYGFSISFMNTYKPFILSSMMYPKMMSCEMQSIEGKLIEVTKQQQETVSGLEDIKKQMEIFDIIPYQSQVDDLIKSIVEFNKGQHTELNDMMALYNQEKIEELFKYTQDSNKSVLKDYNDIMVNDRNKNWIPVIEKAATEKPTFFGVGAAHLPGKEGVLNLLKKAGYTVKPIMQ